MFPAVSFLAIVLGHLAQSTSAQKTLPDVNGVAGSTVDLQPGSTDSSITSVTWKHNGDLAVELLGGELTYYREFKDRTSLNTQNGVLTIRDLIEMFNGVYQVEINDRVISSQKLQVFNPVLKPTISMDKITETSYVLTCNSDVNDKAQSVQVKWIIDDKETSEVSKTLTINEGIVARSFVCMLINPVSNASSEAVKNPFLRDPVNHGPIIGIVVGIIISAVVVLSLFVLIVKPPPSWKDKPVVKRLRDSGLGKWILSTCSSLTGNPNDAPTHAESEMGKKSEEDNQTNGKGPTEASAQQPLTSVGSVE